MSIGEVRYGAPCKKCGLPQFKRAEGCTRTREECAYGSSSIAVTDTPGHVSPRRLARMLKLYAAATDNVTQKQIASEAGISVSTLSRFLSGEQMPDGRAMAAIIVWCLQ